MCINWMALLEQVLEWQICSEPKRDSHRFMDTIEAAIAEVPVAHAEAAPRNMYASCGGTMILQLVSLEQSIMRPRGKQYMQMLHLPTNCGQNTPHRAR
jgi:hypothetical protein